MKITLTPAIGESPPKIKAKAGASTGTMTKPTAEAGANVGDSFNLEDLDRYGRRGGFITFLSDMLSDPETQEKPIQSVDYYQDLLDKLKTSYNEDSSIMSFEDYADRRAKLENLIEKAKRM